MIFDKSKDKYKINKKVKPLLMRLEDALNCSTSVEEENKIYDLVGRYCKKIDKYNKGEFYSNLTQKRLNLNFIPSPIYINKEYKNNGEKIVKELKQEISLPKAGTKNYWHNLNEIMDIEYNIIKNFYSKINNKNGN